VFEFDGDVFADIDVNSLSMMSFKKQLESLASVIYVYSVEAAFADSSSQSIFTGDA
jgi:hypothetical protein